MGPAQIEKRIAALEEELSRLRDRVEGKDTAKPWWERIAGTFQEDPVYQEAMKLGQQYRRSLKPRSVKRRRGDAGS
jgi:hypothetical protein